MTAMPPDHSQIQLSSEAQGSRNLLPQLPSAIPTSVVGYQPVVIMMKSHPPSSNSYVPAVQYMQQFPYQPPGSNDISASNRLCYGSGIHSPITTAVNPDAFSMHPNSPNSNGTITWTPLSIDQLGVPESQLCRDIHRDIHTNGQALSTSSSDPLRQLVGRSGCPSLLPDVPGEPPDDPAVIKSADSEAKRSRMRIRNVGINSNLTSKQFNVLSTRRTGTKNAPLFLSPASKSTNVPGVGVDRQRFPAAVPNSPLLPSPVRVPNTALVPSQQVYTHPLQYTQQLEGLQFITMNPKDFNQYLPLGIEQYSHQIAMPNSQVISTQRIVTSQNGRSLLTSQVPDTYIQQRVSAP